MQKDTSLTSLFGSVGSSGESENLTLSTSCLGMLTSGPVAPIMADTSVDADLLHSLNIGSDSANQHVHHALRGLAVNEISLSVDEPLGDLVLGRVVDNGDELLNLFVGKGTSASINIYFCFLAN